LLSNSAQFFSNTSTPPMPDLREGWRGKRRGQEGAREGDEGRIFHKEGHERSRREGGEKGGRREGGGREGGREGLPARA
jgi:hypothetical protein